MLPRIRNQKDSLGGFRRRCRRSILRVEELESRFLFSAGGLDNIFASPDKGPGGRVTNPFPVGYDPAQIRHAYGFDQITFGTVAGDGSGQTIAIVDAYDDPNILKDLHVFDSTFGLPDPVFTKATPQGHTKANASWAGEISLDVEWAHAIAPGANILLVEAASASLGNLLDAVSYANSQKGVVAVSMSWGGGEFSSELSFDSFFTTPGITYTAASGDSPGASWPSTSPNVISVGGTTLPLDTAGDYPTGNETGWSSSGGGTSAYESLPSYQSGVTGTSTRATPDVAFDADPNTGVAIYVTVAQFGQTGWFQVGGTSLGAPAWAALVAIADQGRGAGASLSSTQTLATLYANQGDFHDITSGTSGSNSAHAGYDLVTGLGTPKAQQIVQHLVTAPALKIAAVQSSGSTSTNGKTPASNNTPSITTSEAQALSFLLFSGTQPQLSYGPVTPGNPISVPLPATSSAVFVPPSFTAVGASSGATGFGDPANSAPAGLGPVLPAPENQQPPDSSAGKPASRMNPEQAPGDSRTIPANVPQNDQAPPMPSDKAKPNGKKEDAAPGDGFWEGSGAVDGAILSTSDDRTSEFMSESAALIPGLVAFLSGSWGIRLVDSDSKKSEVEQPTTRADS
jgi:hypothetical protein